MRKIFKNRHKIKLKKRNWWDIDQLIAEAVPKLLIDFIEVEAAWMYVRLNPGHFSRKENFIFWWKSTVTGTFRSAEYGVEYLKEHKVINPNRKKEIDAILTAYTFFKNTPDWCDFQKTLDLQCGIDCDKWNAMNLEERKSILHTMKESEEKYLKDQDKHLLNIIKNRHILWT